MPTPVQCPQALTPQGIRCALDVAERNHFSYECYTHARARTRAHARAKNHTHAHTLACTPQCCALLCIPKCILVTPMWLACCCRAACSHTSEWVRRVSLWTRHQPQGGDHTQRQPWPGEHLCQGQVRACACACWGRVCCTLCARAHVGVSVGVQVWLL